MVVLPAVNRGLSVLSAAIAHGSPLVARFALSAQATECEPMRSPLDRGPVCLPVLMGGQTLETKSRCGLLVCRP